MSTHAETHHEAERQQRIAERAYRLFQERGAIHGQDVTDWLEAERQILDEIGEQDAIAQTALRRLRPRTRAEAPVSVSTAVL